jgi:hypothetical protein
VSVALVVESRNFIADSNDMSGEESSTSFHFGDSTELTREVFWLQ